MRITFDPAFDFGAWPGPLGNRVACIDEAWLGPMGLIDHLETICGAGGKYLTDDQRAVGLIGRIKKADAFFSKSAGVDPIGTAKKLLAWRDSLCMGGWEGQGTSTRLSQLAAVTKEVSPGVPDRLKAIARALDKQKIDDIQIRIIKPIQKLGKAWQAVFTALARAGVEIGEIDLPDAKAKGNLALCRAKESFVPQENDDSLVLYRPGGVLEGAEEVAAWLAEKKDLSSVVIIGADTALDWALYRHGLPTTGAKASAQDNALLSILPLIMDLAWAPPDPQKAFDLLLLHVSPMPPFLANALAGALLEYPAVGSDHWRGAIGKFLPTVEDNKERKEIEQWLKLLFQPTVERGQRIASGAIVERIDLLESWLKAKRNGTKGDIDSWDAAISQCEAMRGLSKTAGFSDFSQRELERLVEVATDAVGEKPCFEDQVGLASVKSPGAIAGYVDTVVWWGFTLSNFSVKAPPPLTSAERKGLLSAGVELQSIEVLAAQVSSEWQRPFHQVARELIMVCPQKTTSGEEEFAHPAWDEIKARLKDDKLIYLIERQSLAAGKRHKRELHPLVKPTMDYKIGENLVGPRKKPESATSLSSLLSCPFKYVVDYVAHIRSGRVVALNKVDDPLLRGKVAHDVLEMLLREMKNGKTFTAETARAAVEAWFDSTTPRLAAQLWLPGNDAERAFLRNTISRAAGTLTDILNKSRLTVLKVEEEETGEGFGVALSGKPDVVVGEPKGIVDIKWGDASRRVEELKNGAAVQLALYSSLVRSRGADDFLPVAYFIVSHNRMLSLAGKGAIGDEVIRGPSLQQTCEAMEKTLVSLWAALRKGEVRALGVETNDDKQEKQGPGQIDGEGLSLFSRCKYCDYGVLCGRMFREKT